MPNRLTRVPDAPVPALPGWARWAVLPADGFMLLMVSRPATGSLSRTWVTPATYRMCIVAAVGCAVALGLLLATGTGVTHLAVAAVVAVLLVGSACVALVGAAQRRTR